MRSGRQHRERSRRSNKKQKTKLQFEQRKRMGVTLGEDVELTCGMPEKRLAPSAPSQWSPSHIETRMSSTSASNSCMLQRFALMETHLPVHHSLPYPK